MSISEDKQIYKCFVCGAGGNVFTFVSNYEKISFWKRSIRWRNIPASR
ncbi:MAG: CHC2 zinc finger domain-containing protein [Merdibacter sp.]